MKKTFVFAVLIFLAAPVLALADDGSWYGDNYSYDSGSYYGDNYSYDNSWSDSGSYYDNIWTDSGSYYDNSWSDSGSYYDNSWTDSGSYYDNSWSDSGSYYDNSNYYADNSSYYNKSYDYGYNNNSYDYGYDNYDYGYDNYDYGYNDYNYDYNYNYNNGCTTCTCRGNCNTGCQKNCTTPPPTYEPLDVICIVSDRTIEEDDSVTFTAQAEGGKGSYTYRWSGDASGTSKSVTQRYTNEGIYYATVKVTDTKGNTATANCGSVKVKSVVTIHDLDAICKVSDSSIEEEDRVTFTADVEGGYGSFNYDWSGDVDSSNRSFTQTFNRSGTYEVDLRVTDSRGAVARDTCTVRVKAERTTNNNDRNINVTTRNNTPTNNGTGNLASVNSVYLNQVPYTGPEDVAKGIAFAVGILAWSIGGALIIRNKMNKKSISNRIEAFKSANKNK